MGMDESAARDDLAVVDRILHAADRTFHVPPLIFITWGLYGTIVNGVHQAAASGFSVPPDPAFHLPMMLLAASALAGLAPTWLHGTLATGWFAGMVVPGIVSWGRRAHG